MAPRVYPEATIRGLRAGVGLGTFQKANEEHDDGIQHLDILERA